MSVTKLTYDYMIVQTFDRRNTVIKLKRATVGYQMTFYESVMIHSDNIISWKDKKMLERSSQAVMNVYFVNESKNVSYTFSGPFVFEGTNDGLTMRYQNVRPSSRNELLNVKMKLVRGI